MNYLSLVTSLSKDDLKDLAKQMRVCCSGNKAEICSRILKLLDTYEGSQSGGEYVCNYEEEGTLPQSPEEAVSIFQKLIDEGKKVDGRYLGDFRISTGYDDHTVYLEACEDMVDFKDPKDLVSNFLKEHDTNPGQDPMTFIMTYKGK